MTDELDFKVYKILHIPTARCHGIFNRCLYFSDKDEALTVIKRARYAREESDGIIYISEFPGDGYVEISLEHLELLELQKHLVPNNVYSTLRRNFLHSKGIWNV